ncbi:unnamed protein product [Anisakis simplex]|uniref:tRNA selenocysteine 1-associated protein 1 (inferred by orthology to a human protein) n=1 Tax=Anisakis simplex TaxID=6269 RepID=A0A0M3JAH3_ANISI|nr:unnamed protein product [Anisakis simplex]
MLLIRFEKEMMMVFFSYTEYNLFVNNVPEDMDDAALFLIFGERYHSCRGAKVYRNSDGTSKGLGFVRFSDQTDQQRALLEMNKYRVDGRPLLLKLAQPKYRAPKQSKQPHIQQQQQPYPMHLPQQMMPQHPQITNLYDPSSSNYYMHHQVCHPFSRLFNRLTFVFGLRIFAVQKGFCVQFSDGSNKLLRSNVRCRCISSSTANAVLHEPTLSIQSESTATSTTATTTTTTISTI